MIWKIWRKQLNLQILTVMTRSILSLYTYFYCCQAIHLFHIFSVSSLITELRAFIIYSCGCPSPKVAGHGCFGVSLMLDPKVWILLITLNPFLEQKQSSMLTFFFIALSWYIHLIFETEVCCWGHVSHCWKHRCSCQCQM